MNRFALLVFCSASWPVWAGVWQPVVVEASLDLRHFPVESESAEWAPSQQGTLESMWQAEDRRQSVDLALFARWDERDRGRRDIDVRRLWYSRRYGDLTLGAGVQQEFWGVTESRHLVNVLNQIDAVEDIDEEDLLGQPMIKFAYATPIGQFAAYILPYFRERPRHEYGERLSVPLDVSSEGIYESGAEEYHVDTAIRYSLQRGALDLGLSYFNGTNREPRLTLDRGEVRDRYEQIEQWGIDGQWTTGPWLLKLEGLRRADAVETFTAYVVGLEYTFFQVVGRIDLSFVAERLKDHRRVVGAPTPYQDDWFGAVRISWNDMFDSSLLIGGYYDRDETLLRLELQRRVTDQWSIDLSVTSFNNVDPQSAAFPVRRDGFVSLKLTHHF